MVVAELMATLGLVPDTGSFDKGHELIDGLHHALEAYLGYEGIKKVNELVQGTVEAAVEAKHLGERLGITAESVQELGYAADVSGASAEDMTVAMQRLALGMEHVKKTGSGPLAEGLRALHIPIQALKGETLDQNLEAIAEGFKKAGPQVNKTGIAMELFGRSGAKLIPLLNKGKDGIVELRNEAEKMGVVIDEAGIQKSEEFEIAQKKLGASLKGIRNEAVIAMLPALQDMAEGLLKWIQANREAITSTLEAVLKGVAAAFRTIGQVISAVINFFKEHQTITNALIGAFQTLIKVITWIGDNAEPLLMVIVAPFAAMAAAIVFVLKMFGLLLDNARAIGRGILDAFYAIGRGIVGAFEAVAHAVIGAFQAAFDFIANMPVVKQILEAIAWAKGGPSDDDPKEIGKELAAGNDSQGFKDMYNDPTSEFYVPEGGARADGDVNQTFVGGDTHIQIDAAGMDPDTLKDVVTDAVKDGQKDMLRQARDNIAGGKR